MLIAGPCSAESEEQLLETAHALSGRVDVFRAGLWKPRTKPGGFEGVGAVGLPWLQRVRCEAGVRIATEVATPQHVEAALSHDMDMLWLGARTTANPFAVQELADSLRGVEVPILVKNPVCPDLELWMGAIERLRNAGIRDITAVHRGFSTYDRNVYRNPPQWAIPIELRRRCPDLRLLCDPSHMGGSRELVAPLSQQALDLGFDGLMVEVHPHPDTSLSDREQQITPDEFLKLVDRLVLREDGADLTANKNTEASLSELRDKIDRLDAELVHLLGDRMEVVERIGAYKRTHHILILQPNRYNDMLRVSTELGERLGMPREFIEKVLQAVHEESIRRQLDQT